MLAKPDKLIMMLGIALSIATVLTTPAPVEEQQAIRSRRWRGCITSAA